MAYKKQLVDAQNDIRLQNVAGVVSTSPQFTALVNEAQERLISRGDFFGLTQEAVFVFQGCYVVWPKYVGTILAARAGRHGGTQVSNMWYSFTGSWHRHHSFWHGDIVLQDAGETCVFQDITGGGDGQIIQYNVQQPQDLGTTITLYGTQFGNQPLQQSLNNVWQDGLTLTAATPYARTSVSVTNIQSIVKQPTAGYVTLYEYDAASNTNRLLGVYGPNDTHPRFRRSCVVNFNSRFGCNPNNSTVPVYHQMEVLVKLEFIPVVNQWDFLLIDEFVPLKFAIQAIKSEEAGDIQTANAFFLRAIAELNMIDRNKMPTWETPVSVMPLMGGRIRNPN